MTTATNNIQVKTDVLIVGSGPAGGSMALALSTYKIPNLVITRYGRLVRTPRAHITNQRTMEVMRDLGVEDQVKAVATPQELMGNNVFCESLAGDELGRIHSWQTHPLRHAAAQLASPTSINDTPQNLMEPILIQNALERGYTTIRYNTEYISHEEVGEQEDHDEAAGAGVITTVKDHLTGQIYKIWSKYLYGADGGNSKVASNCRLPFKGKMGIDGSINIVFEADLTKYVAHRPSVLYWILQPNCDIGGIGMGLIRMVRPWNKWLIVWGYDISSSKEGPPKITNEYAIKVARDLIGDKDIDIKIDSCSTWTVNNMYATQNISLGKKVFCGGDAIHRHPPSNGLGSNTSIQDSYNLAWKLAYVIRGQASPSLLMSYQDERIPVAKQVVTRANQSIREFRPIFDAIGFLKTTDPVKKKRNASKRKENTLEGRTQREALRQAFLLKRYEFDAHGVDMNHVYRSSAIVLDNMEDNKDYDKNNIDGLLPREPPITSSTNNNMVDTELNYIRTSMPGAKVPHNWFRRCSENNNKPLATLDLCGKGEFTLLTGIGGEGWIEAAKTYCRQVQINTYMIGPGQQFEDIYQEWLEISEIDEDGCLLIRPDGYIGYRCQTSSSSNATELLHNAMNQILGWS